MKNLLVWLVLFSITQLFAAEFVVTEFKEQPMDVELARNPVKDINGEYAALIKISTDLLPFAFETNIGVVDTKTKTGEFWAYVPGGASQLIFTKSGFNRFRYPVPVTIKKNTVYTIKLSSKGYGVEVADENLVQVTFNLNESGVFIALDDSAPIMQQEKVAVYKVPKGEHEFQFSKNGFNDVTRRLDATQDATISITMQAGNSASRMKLPGYLDISSQPTGAEIFINDQKMGVTPATIELTAGEHRLTLRKNLYHSYNGSFVMTEKQTTTLKAIELLPMFGYYQVASSPSGGQVFLDGKPVGTTPVAKKVIASGMHQLRVTYDMHHEYREDFTIQDGDSRSFDVSLKPAFGSLLLHTTPEEGAQVFVDGSLVGTTPYRDEKIASGTYRVRVDKELWMGAEEMLTISDEQTTEKTLLLTRNFANLTVTAPGATIQLDGQNKGSDRYEEKLPKGEYEVRAVQDKHHTASQTVHIIPGKDVRVELHPEPMLAGLSVQSNPYDSKGAEIWLNGKKQKDTTPGVMELLVGEYEVTLKHPRFLEATQQVNLKEHDQKKLVFDMQTYKGSMLSKAHSWRTSKWISLASTVLCAGAGVYCNMQGDAAFDDYEAATTTADAVSYRDDLEGWYDKRDLSYTVSIIPALWSVYSLVKESYYNRQSVRK
jgi:hypothetical protein